MSKPPLTKESVWDYPRPPRLEPTGRRIRVAHMGLLIADTADALRVLETSHPPVYYIPQTDLRMEFLKPKKNKRTFCEFKGEAIYWNILIPQNKESDRGQEILIESAAWSYEDPQPEYAQMAGHLAFYASRVSECWVDEERVVSQPGDFYGGWITADVVGPFKGGAGTLGW